MRDRIALYSRSNGRKVQLLYIHRGQNYNVIMTKILKMKVLQGSRRKSPQGLQALSYISHNIRVQNVGIYQFSNKQNDSQWFWEMQRPKSSRELQTLPQLYEWQNYSWTFNGMLESTPRAINLNRDDGHIRRPRPEHTVIRDKTQACCKDR